MPGSTATRTAVGSIENNRSLNGVWLRIKRLPIKGSCRFMIGEQQCLVRIPR